MVIICLPAKIKMSQSSINIVELISTILTVAKKISPGLKVPRTSCASLGVEPHNSPYFDPVCVCSVAMVISVLGLFDSINSNAIIL
jgi:hypothetical protein